SLFAWAALSNFSFTTGSLSSAAIKSSAPATDRFRTSSNRQSLRGILGSVKLILSTLHQHSDVKKPTGEVGFFTVPVLSWCSDRRKSLYN
ncbi:hypothetical protein XQ81_25285, partial [Salmonella enterica]|nr:hypothetical protein [Salmonella enterica]